MAGGATGAAAVAFLAPAGADVSLPSRMSLLMGAPALCVCLGAGDHRIVGLGPGEDRGRHVSRDRHQFDIEPTPSPSRA